MALQLIFTSTPQGLEPGRSGYCTVARHKDIRQRLVRELERLSVYDFGQQVGANRVDISVYRKIALGSEEFYVLTRICDAGMDYTNRTNYLAHHLILDGFEIATSPSPAEVFLNWNGWKRKWEEGPRYLTPGEEVKLSGFKSKGLVPCKNWLSFTNDPGNGASLVSQSMVKPIVLENAPGQSSHLLQLFAESCALLKLQLDAWDYSFTTYLQGNDDPKSFAWLGIEGQPAGERLKQGGLRNYIDLRDWSGSSITDEIDPSLSHIARKGPTAPPTRRVKRGTSSSTRSPLSSQQVDKIKATSSAYLSSAPSGSSVSQQEPSLKKNKKKRPWLLQLAVISTALCLLGALIFGLVYNLGDWFNKDEVTSDNKSQTIEKKSDEKDSKDINSRPLAFGSFANLDSVEYLRVVEKPAHLRWLKIDVGTSEPLRVKINDKHFEKFENVLDQISEGDDLEVIVKKNDEGLFFDELKNAPALSNRGKLEKISFNENKSVNFELLENKFSIKLADKKYEFDMRRSKPSDRDRIGKLVALLDSGNQIPFSFRSNGSKIFHIDSFKLPSDENLETSAPKEPVNLGKDMVIFITGGKKSIELEEKQMRIAIPIDENEIDRKYYLYKENELPRLEELDSFSKEGNGRIELRIKLKEDQITFLQFEIPSKSEPETDFSKLTPKDFQVSKRIVFWVPGENRNNGWVIDPQRSFLTFEDKLTSSLLFSLFQTLNQTSLKPSVWMTDYKPGQLFDEDVFNNNDDIEEVSFDYEGGTSRDELVKYSTISFKLGNTLSLEFDIYDTIRIDVDYSSSHAWNSLNNGKIIRIPNPESKNECIDLFFLSNKHGESSRPKDLGFSFSLQENGLSLKDDLLGPESFRFLFTNEPRLFALSAKKYQAIDLQTMFRDYSEQDFIKPGKLSNLPSILLLNDKNPFSAKIKLELDYFSDVTNLLNRWKAYVETTKPEGMDEFPNNEVYDRFLFYAKEHSDLIRYDVGTSFSQFLYNIPLSFIKKYFEWDDVKYSNLKNKLDLNYNVPDLAYNPELIASLWSIISDEIKKYFIADYNKNIFVYKKEHLTKHMQLVFEALSLMLKVEKLYALNDEDLSRKFNDLRNKFASTDFGNEESPFVKFNKEISNLEKDHPEVREKFSQYMANFNKSKNEITPNKDLSRNSIKVVLDTLSDLGKNSLYLKSKDSVIRYKNGITTIQNKINEILNRMNNIRAAEPDITERKIRIVKEIPWTIGIYKKDSNGEWEKESDFLRLAPPANL